MTVKDKAGQPVSGLDVAVHFFYPATRKLDRQIAAAAVAEGVYSGARRCSRAAGTSKST